MFSKAKILEWIKRYGPAEIGGIITIYMGYFAIDYISNFEIAAAFVGALTENAGFYGVILYQRLKKEKHKKKRTHLVEILTEFGPAELLDSFVLRPACLVFGVEFLGPGLGVLFGKLSSDALFYVPVIATYELKNHWAKKTQLS